MPLWRVNENEKSFILAHNELLNYGIWVIEMAGLCVSTKKEEKEGSVVQIKNHTTPLSMVRIPSHEPVRAMLQINARLADTLGIGVGAIVQYYLIGK